MHADKVPIYVLCNQVQASMTQALFSGPLGRQRTPVHYSALSQLLIVRSFSLFTKYAFQQHHRRLSLEPQCPSILGPPSLRILNPRTT